MGKGSYAQPTTCNKMFSINTTIGWEAELLRRGTGYWTHESVSQH